MITNRQAGEFQPEELKEGSVVGAECLRMGVHERVLVREEVDINAQTPHHTLTLPTCKHTRLLQLHWHQTPTMSVVQVVTRRSGTQNHSCHQPIIMY